MNLQDCAALLKSRDDYLLVTHIRPDGDTLGSACALCSALRRLGKKAALYNNPEITENFADFVAPYLAPPGASHALAVSVDTADERVFPLGFTGPVWMALDHHVTGGGFAFHTVLQAHKASCGELILELITELCGALTKEEASLLYMAVSTDTGCFCYANTSAETFYAAGRLAEAGAEVAKINKLMFRTKSRARLVLEGMLYAGLQSFRDNRLNVAVVTLDMMARSGATENDCDDLASLAGRVANNRAAITVRELVSGYSKVSLRTDGSIDAAALCARHGGGGHKMAAGCEFNGDPFVAAEKVRLAVEEVWN